MEGNARVTKNNWDGGVQVYDMPDAGKFTDQIRVNEPFSMPHVTIMDAKTAYNYVLENAGATFPKRDAVDTRVIKTVKTGKAIYVKDAPEFVSPYVKSVFLLILINKVSLQILVRWVVCPNIKVLLWLIRMVMVCRMPGR